jgi:FkbM family methyltransferase
MKYWHHLQNDRWVAEAVFPGLREGYFVEAGACEGRYQSGTYALETELGWGGICVEPGNELYRLMVKTRRCETDNRALWSRSGETVQFSVIDADKARSGIAGVFQNEDSLRLAEAGAQTEEKETITLQDLLAEHGAPPTIHYLCLDIEGAEEAVMGAFDLADGPYKLLAVSIEGYRCDELMREAGYLRATNPFTEELYEQYFLHPDLAEKRPHLVVDPSWTGV